MPQWQIREPYTGPGGIYYRSHPNWKAEREAQRVDMQITSTTGTQLKVEFKMGYSTGIIMKGKDSPDLKGIMADHRKRNFPIVSYIGTMDFSDKTEVKPHHRNTQDSSRYWRFKIPESCNHDLSVKYLF